MIPYSDLKIELKDVSPPVWRAIRVPHEMPMHMFHSIIQISMGWQDTHLWDFVIGGDHYALTDAELENTLPLEEMDLGGALKIAPLGFQYNYDFGDGWNHSVTPVHAPVLRDEDEPPRCLGGERACPPENVGGPHGYEEFLEILRNPQHERHEELCEWVGGQFDPECFSWHQVNAYLSIWCQDLLFSLLEGEEEL